MIKIYHNPRCSKSRNGLEIVKESGKDYEIRSYLKDIPSKEELKNLLALLNIKAEDLIRKNESIWKDNYKGKDLTETQLIEAMIKFPKLIERPIVINGKKAVIGRPPEKISEIL
ncbi:arsenate reductase (glutaredoxin) [Xanthomarina sp. F2636L]|uniref:arsenate reductase (glutaredoxin) n=1 Tax=Xanthomarina sp. F2636L TaxID=2996018 RepID=UPI00225E356C|nr:arsenate reductase (glutaredoxin) [Xanthomarina sp. F2636L]MCX7549772.1 arsenate reductase (glutaredoxin) [Xanthomarina sp. F2636L]